MARQRRIEPKKLSTTLRGDLDWIVMKCLEKDRSRRYETTEALAADVRRFLHHQPVLASPPSVSYRLRKFTRRHKGALTALASVVTALLVGLSLATYGLVSARRERDRAVKAEAQATTLNEFLVNDVLASADPQRSRGRAVTVDELLARAAKNVVGTFREQPELEAAVRLAIGETYLSIGHYSEASEHLTIAESLRRRVLGPEHAETLWVRTRLGELLLVQGRYDEAEAVTRSTWEAQSRTMGADHPRTLTAAGNLAMILNEQGKHDAAEALMQRTLGAERRVYGAEHGNTLNSMINLAHILAKQGKHQDAEQLQRQTLELQRRVVGRDHPDTLALMHNLATALRSQGRFAEAEPLYRETLASMQRVNGPEHPNTLVSMNELAKTLVIQKKYQEADELLGRTLEISTRVLGDDHPDTLHVVHALGWSRGRQNKLAEAEQLYRRALEGRKRVLGDDHPDTRMVSAQLLSVLQRQGKLDDHRPFVVEHLQRLRRAMTDSDAGARSMNDFAWLLLTVEPVDLRDPATALQFAIQANEQTEFGSPGYLDTLARAYYETGDSTKALEIQKKAIALTPPDSPIRSALEEHLEQYLKGAEGAEPASAGHADEEAADNS